MQEEFGARFVSFDGVSVIKQTHKSKDLTPKQDAEMITDYALQSNYEGNKEKLVKKGLQLFTGGNV